MFDCLTNSHRIVDVKTCRDPSEDGFARALDENGYYRQCALYCRARDSYMPFTGDNVAEDTDQTGFSWIAVGNCGDFDCCVYHVGQPTLELGKAHLQQVLEALADFRDFQAGQEWQNHGTDRPRVINVKPWTFNKELPI